MFESAFLFHFGIKVSPAKLSGSSIIHTNLTSNRILIHIHSFLPFQELIPYWKCKYQWIGNYSSAYKRQKRPYPLRKQKKNPIGWMFWWKHKKNTHMSLISKKRHLAKWMRINRKFKLDLSVKSTTKPITLCVTALSHSHMRHMCATVYKHMCDVSRTVQYRRRCEWRKFSSWKR